MAKLVTLMDVIHEKSSLVYGTNQCRANHGHLSNKSYLRDMNSGILNQWTKFQTLTVVHWGKFQCHFAWFQCAPTLEILSESAVIAWFILYSFKNISGFSSISSQQWSLKHEFMNINTDVPPKKAVWGNNNKTLVTIFI